MNVSVTSAPELLRRPPSRRRRAGLVSAFLGALVRVLVVVGVPIGLSIWLLTSPYFAIEDVEVTGAARVSGVWVETTLASLEGQNLWRVSLDGVDHRLAQHPWVDRVELRRELPRRLVVRVIEREPVALLETATGLVWLDAAGATIAPWDGEGQADDFVRVRWSKAEGPVPVESVQRLVTSLVDLLPAGSSGPATVTVLGDEDYRIEARGLPAPLVVRATTLEAGVGRLDVVLKEMGRRNVESEVIDLRLPERVLVRPRPSAAQGGGDGVTVESKG